MDLKDLSNLWNFPESTPTNTELLNTINIHRNIIDRRIFKIDD